MSNESHDKNDVFKAIDKIRVGDRIQVDDYVRHLCYATVDRVYYIGSGKYFDLTIEYEHEKLFGGKIITSEKRRYDFTSMVRSLVRDAV